MTEHLPINPQEQIHQQTDLLYSTDHYFLHEGVEFTDIVPTPGDSARVVDGLVQARELFEELESIYNISHAGFMPVVIKTQAGLVGELVVSNRVEGEQCQDPEKGIPKHQLPAARSLFEKLNRYVVDKSQSGEAMLTDIFNLRQYIYQPEKDEMICVDVDPYFEKEQGVALVQKEITSLAKAVLSRDEFSAWNDKMEEMARKSTDKGVVFTEDF